MRVIHNKKNKNISDIDFELLGVTLSSSVFIINNKSNKLVSINEDNYLRHINFDKISITLTKDDSPDFIFCYDDNDYMSATYKIKVYEKYIVKTIELSDSDPLIEFIEIKGEIEETVHLVLSNLLNLSDKENMLIWYIMSKFYINLNNYENLLKLKTQKCSVAYFTEINNDIFNFNEYFDIKMSENFISKYLPFIDKNISIIER